jgi:hypothetical protein
LAESATTSTGSSCSNHNLKKQQLSHFQEEAVATPRSNSCRNSKKQLLSQLQEETAVRNAKKQQLLKL